MLDAGLLVLIKSHVSLGYELIRRLVTDTSSKIEATNDIVIQSSISVMFFSQWQYWSQVHSQLTLSLFESSLSMHIRSSFGGVVDVPSMVVTFLGAGGNF